MKYSGGCGVRWRASCSTVESASTVEGYLIRIWAPSTVHGTLHRTAKTLPGVVIQGTKSYRYLPQISIPQLIKIVFIKPIITVSEGDTRKY